MTVAMSHTAGLLSSLEAKKVEGECEGESEMDRDLYIGDPISMVDVAVLVVGVDDTA